jgi:hypothetical protein
MKLWTISQTVNDDCDTYSDAVVAAKTEEDARNTHPAYAEATYRDGKWWVKRANGSPMSINYTWASPEQVTAVCIGEASEGTKPGVVCASFHAG